MSVALVLSVGLVAPHRPAQAAPAEPAPESAVLERPDEAAAVATARLTGKRVQIAGLTSETSQYWANPDGRIDAEVHLGPVRTRDDTGTWTPVDFNLAWRPDGSVAAKAHPSRLRLSGEAGEGEHDLVSLGQGDQTLSLGWVGKLPKPTLSGTRATYSEVRPGVDLVVEATRTGFEQFLIVKNRASVVNARELAVPLRGKGLTVVDDGKGGFDIKDGAGAVVGTSPAAEMWDAQVSPQSGERVRRATVGKKAGAKSLTLTPDEKWLTDPATVYPVTIDPAVTLKPNYDAFVQIGYNSDQSAATELKLGTYDGGSTKARSFMRFDGLDRLRGSQVQSATLNLWNHHSWSCEARQWAAYSVGPVSTATRWAAQPTWGSAAIGTSTATKGNTCAAGWVTVPVTKAFADYASGATTGSVNIGLRASSETDNLAWKRFHSMEGANDPYVSVSYQSSPTITSRATVPATACAVGSVRPWINTTTPQLRAQLNDGEGSAITATFEWWVTGGSKIGQGVVGPGASGSWLGTTVPAGTFVDGGTYSWRVRGNDGTLDGGFSSFCEFTVDTVAPPVMPSVASATYPPGQWSGGAGIAGTFLFSAAGVTDVAAYEYGLNANPPNQTVNAATLGAEASVSITPTSDGPQTLYVRTRDRAGNQSPTRAYSFSVGIGAVTGPRTGDITAAQTAINGVGQPGATGATYQWRRADTDAWVDIPTGHVSVAAGGGAVTWPVPTSGDGAFPKLNWDVEATLKATDVESIARDGPLQVRASFTGFPGGASNPVRITFDRAQASAAGEEIGPGEVNLITGNYTLSETDVSVDAAGSDLTVTRSYSTRRAAATDTAEMFGPGWVSGAVVEEAEAPYTSLTVFGSLVQVGLPDGDTIGFTKRNATEFGPESGMEALKLTYNNDIYTLADEDGTIVAFTRVAGTAAGKYFPTGFTMPGDGQTTTLSWERVTINGKEVVRPTRMLAPTADGISCATLARGCRALTFTYGTTTTATGTAEAQWGDHVGRVKEISYTAWDSELATPAMRTVVMARYAYDNTGRLRATWDPRLDWTDNGQARQHKDTYTYGTDGVLTTIKPHGQEPWQLTYTTVPGDPGAGRLHKVTRSALAAGTATTTVVYKVPLSGSGAPYDLSPGQTARWGQVEAPTNATAVLPPNETSFERATVTYLDANGREVNTATPGGHLTTTWYDQFGNTVRTLDAANRARALNAAPANPAELAQALSAVSVYSADGQRLTDTLGPEHEVMLPNGTTVRGRAHTRFVHDEGAPSTGAPYNLVTSRYDSVQFRGPTGALVDDDVRRTNTAYDWTLRMPVTETLDPGGLALATRTAYDAATGLVTSVTSPAGGTATNTPATRRTVYYRATSGSGFAECDLRPEWANLPCRVQPGGQAASGPELPAQVTTYDMFGQSRVETEKTSAGTLRTTTTTYDGAGRPVEVAVSAAAGLGTAVPVQRNVYDAATGEIVRTESLVGGLVVGRIIKEYDTLGRQIAYTDADNNRSTVSFDLQGRPATEVDGKASRTFTYDGGTERRGLATAIVDTQAGTFTASYDANGSVERQTWPNGIVVDTRYDETGSQSGITYTRSGCTGANCTLLAESVTESAHGQWRLRASTLSKQQYRYDASGRLAGVSDTVGSQCVSRSYGFNTASSRNTAANHASAADGGCQTATTASSRTWTYDTADRVTGYGYDALGRTTTVAAADGGATVGYHTSDFVDTISQGGRTVDYTVDVDGERVRSWTDTAGGVSVQATHHYDGDEDTPVWTQEDPVRYTRVVSAVSGLAGTYNSESGQIDWQLTNLHGDVVATVHGGDAGLSSTSEATEYGVPREAGDVGSQRYGWLGAKQRAADTPSGLVLMGVRVYNPATGRFLQVDPEFGGSCNAYDYTCADPVNKDDVDGKWISIAFRLLKASCKIGRWCVRSAKYVGKQAWRGAKWGGRQVWRGAKWGGRKVWSGMKWGGKKAWSGAKWAKKKTWSGARKAYRWGKKAYRWGRAQGRWRLSAAATCGYWMMNKFGFMGGRRSFSLGFAYGFARGRHCY